MPGAGQPLFPIGGAPAAAGSLQLQTGGQPGGQPQLMGAGPPGGSLFPINVQDGGARPAIATHPGQPNIPFSGIMASVVCCVPQTTFASCCETYHNS